MPRYGETVLSVPVTISAWTALRQALRPADGSPRESLPFVLRGKLSAGPLGTVRFTRDGTLRWADLPRAMR